MKGRVEDDGRHGGRAVTAFSAIVMLAWSVLLLLESRLVIQLEEENQRLRQVVVELTTPQSPAPEVTR